jgi:hypothetical protein
LAQTTLAQTGETHVDPRSQTATETVTDQRVEVDVDGDGVPDGFVLLRADPSHAAQTEPAPSHDWIGL